FWIRVRTWARRKNSSGPGPLPRSLAPARSPGRTGRFLPARQTPNRPAAKHSLRDERSALGPEPLGKRANGNQVALRMERARRQQRSAPGLGQTTRTGTALDPRRKRRPRSEAPARSMGLDTMKSFDRAASTYDRFAFIQRDLAQWLAEWLP